MRHRRRFEVLHSNLGVKEQVHLQRHMAFEEADYLGRPAGRS
jgi:hypothetical protein